MNTTLADFITFLRNIVQIPASVLPDNSPFITTAYQLAVELVYCPLQSVGSGFIYTQAVYNLGTDILVNIAQDQTGQTPPDFWAQIRNKYGINTFVAGVIQSSNDESTGQAMVVPEAFKELTIANLQNLKTPWGRAYLGFVQSWGQDWGLS